MEKKKIGFQGKEDRQQMVYHIQHMIYAIKKFNTKDNDVKDEVTALLQTFFTKVPECKYGWQKALDSFIHSLEKRCDCNACIKHFLKDELSQNDTPIEDMKKELERIGMVIKISTFTKVVNDEYTNYFARKGEERKDGQQVHTVNHYANKLKNLKIPYDSNDIYSGCALQNIHHSDIRDSFLMKYKEDLVDVISGKLSYKGEYKSIDFRDTVSLWLRVAITKEVKKHIDLDNDTTQIIADLYSDWIWDVEDDYKPRGQFIYFLLHTFGFIRWEADSYSNHPVNRYGNFGQDKDYYPIDDVKGRTWNKIISTIEVMRGELVPYKFNLMDECR